MSALWFFVRLAVMVIVCQMVLRAPRVLTVLLESAVSAVRLYEDIVRHVVQP